MNNETKEPDSLECHHISMNTFYHLLRHTHFPSNLRPMNSSITNLSYHFRCILNTIRGCKRQQVSTGNTVKLTVYRHLVLRRPTPIRIKSIAHIVCRRQPPLAVLIHQERDVLRMVVLIAHNHIEHHPAEHLPRRRIWQPQSAHYVESLLVGIPPQQPEVIVRQATECLHVHLAAVLTVESTRQEVRPVNANQRSNSARP